MLCYMILLMMQAMASLPKDPKFIERFQIVKDFILIVIAIVNDVGCF